MDLETFATSHSRALSKQLPLLRRRNGRFTGFPVLGVKWQRMESAGLRQAYGLVPPRKGVLVRSIWPTSPVSKEVRPDDIIMRFDGVDIACDGTVPFRRARPSRDAAEPHACTPSTG